MRLKRRRGQVLLLSTVILAVVLGLVGSFVGYLGGVRKATGIFSARAAAREAARAGIEKALWCMNKAVGTDCGGTYGGSYAGQTAVSIGGSAYYTTVVTTVSSTFKTITSTGYYPNVTNPIDTVKLKADASVTTVEASFHYGVQSGEGGFEMGNNAHVDGNIYANGSVTGSNGAYVTGDVWVAGGTALTPDQSQTTNNEDYTFGQVSPVIDIAQSFKLSGNGVLNKVRLYLRKVGSPGDATVMILADDNGVPSKTVVASTNLSAASVTSSFSWIDASFSTPPGLVENVTYWLVIDAASSGTKYWVTGSLPNNGYGNGVGMRSANWDAGTPVWTDAGRDFTFEAYTGGVVTMIDNVDVNGDAHANTIKDNTVGGDAYYQTLTNATVTGSQNPGSPDPGPQDFPFSEANIAQWKSEATAGGTITGDVTYDGTSNSVGPKKITGNMTVKNGANLTMTGTIYVQGDLLLDNLAVVNLDPGYGGGSGGFVVDGKITVSNNVTFAGSGTAGSYVVLLTTNPSLDPNSPAMNLNNNSDNSIFYASAGMISIAPGATIKEVTAFKLYIQNTGAVQYESGLANINFSSGPGGSWVLQDGSLREVP